MSWSVWVEIKRLLKYDNSWGWLECKPGAVCIAQHSRWLFHSLITVWSGEMNGSYLRWNNNPLWNPSWIGTAQDDTKKPLIRAGHLAQSGFIWWGLLQHAKKFKITLTFLFKDYKMQRTLSVKNWSCLATNNLSNTCLFILFKLNSTYVHFTTQEVMKWLSALSSDQKLILSLQHYKTEESKLKQFNQLTKLIGNNCNRLIVVSSQNAPKNVQFQLLKCEDFLL